MQPAHFETALTAMFRRLALVAPLNDADGLIERHGLVLAMGFALRDAKHRVRPQPDGSALVGTAAFDAADTKAAFDEASRLALLLVDLPRDGAAHVLDRMAFTMLRLERAGISTTPEVLFREFFTAKEVDQHGMTAAQLAEAVKVAMRRWRQSRAKRQAEANEAAAELEAA